MKNLFLSAIALISFSAAGSEFSGSVGAEIRSYLHESGNPEQTNSNASFYLQPKWEKRFLEDKLQFLAEPYYRYDENDENRSHGDLRELFLAYHRDTWSVLAGVKKIFWGVAETVNHVDIINTRDLADDLNGDRKLGQPMLKFDLFNEWGNFQFYTLPYFRQPTYPSSTSRLGLGFDIETAQPIYQSTEKESHIDYAFRWAHSLNIVDLGLSYFTGTGREPILIPDTITGKLVPHYFLITQYGLDFQVTFETVLLKLEYIERSGLLDETYQAYTTGFEYSFYSLFGTNVDVGIVSEYVYNGFSKASFITPFEDDLFLGVRVALNDTQSSEMLAGVFHDLSGEGNVFSLEASRRISEEYKVILKANIYHDISKNDLILYSIANDDNIQGELIYYF